MSRLSINNGGFLLINKPINWTSFDVVKKVRNILKQKFKLKKLKVGHAGTLDPLASGLLILCVGKMTKEINTFQAQEKEYDGCLYLGSTTPSYDLETEINQTFSTEHIKDEMIYETRLSFLGVINQYPPIFSAIKQKGIRLYEKARKGEKVELETRKVSIYNFDINQIKRPHVYFTVRCSKGTYIRSLAHDFGKALNSGAHLVKLCRTKIGNYNIKDAIELESIEKHIDLLTKDS